MALPAGYVPPKNTPLRAVPAASGGNDEFIVWKYPIKDLAANGDQWHTSRDFGEVVSLGTKLTATDGSEWLKVKADNSHEGLVAMDELELRWYPLPTLIGDPPAPTPGPAKKPAGSPGPAPGPDGSKTRAGVDGDSPSPGPAPSFWKKKGVYYVGAGVLFLVLIVLIIRRKRTDY